MNVLTTTMIAALAALLLYSSGFAVIFTPLPFLYVYMSKGKRSGIFCSAVVAAAVGVFYFVTLKFSGQLPSYLPVLPMQGLEKYFSGPYVIFSGMGHFVFFAAIALALAYGSEKKFELSRLGFAAVASGVAVVLIVALGSFFFDGVNLLAGTKAYLADVAKDVVEINRKAGVQSEYLNILSDKSESVVSLVIKVIPSIAFVFTLFTVVINFLVARRIFKRKHPFAHIHNVARFRLPDYVVWAVIAFGSLFFLNSYLVGNDFAKTVAANGLVAVFPVYFLQGMAVVSYILQGVRMPFMRTLAYVLIIVFFQTISLVIVALGLADVFADFRLKRWRARHHQDM